MTRITTHTGVAVDQSYEWQPLHTCPLSVKVQLLTDLGVAVYSTYTPGMTGVTHWAPLPNRPAPAEAATDVGAEEDEYTEIDWRFVKFCAFVIGLAVVLLPACMLLYLAGVSK